MQIDDESSPPLRQMPTGTSATSRRSTARSNTARKSAGSRGTGLRQHRLPVALDGDAAAVDDRVRGGRHRAHAFEERGLGVVEQAVREVLVHLLVVDVALERGVLEDRLDLRREQHAVARLRVVHRLDAEVVAGEHDAGLVAALVEEGDAPHAVEAGEAVGAPLGVGVEDDLGVAGGAEVVAHRFELGPQLPVVVDLAVVGDVDEPVVGAHRLVAADQVDDAEAAEPEAGGVGLEEAQVVRPAVGLRGRHRFEKDAVARTPEAADTAHLTAQARSARPRARTLPRLRRRAERVLARSERPRAGYPGSQRVTNDQVLLARFASIQRFTVSPKFAGL